MLISPREKQAVFPWDSSGRYKTCFSADPSLRLPPHRDRRPGRLEKRPAAEPRAPRCLHMGSAGKKTVTSPDSTHWLSVTL